MDGEMEPKQMDTGFVWGSLGIAGFKSWNRVFGYFMPYELYSKVLQGGYIGDYIWAYYKGY